MEVEIPGTTFKKTDQKYVFVIEDDAAIRDIIMMLLETEGYKTQGASDGREALDLLRVDQQKPNLILLDLMMPMLDGFGFLREQTKDERLSDIPVIIMSAAGHVEDKIRGTHAKAYLKKPMDLDVALQAVKSHAS